MSLTIAHKKLTHKCNVPRIRTISRRLYYKTYGRTHRIRRSFVCVLLEDYELYVPELGWRLKIKAGFVFDGASIPWFAWQLIGSPTGVHLLKSLPHDAGYITKGRPSNGYPFIWMNKPITRKQLDDLFHAGLHDEEMNEFRVHTSYLAVWGYGWRLWSKKFKSKNLVFVDATKIDAAA